MYVSIGPELFDRVNVREHQDGDKLCVDLFHDGQMAILCLTYGQADSLASGLAAYCQEKQRQAHHETCEDGSPILQVDDELEWRAGV